MSNMTVVRICKVADRESPLADYRGTTCGLQACDFFDWLPVQSDIKVCKIMIV